MESELDVLDRTLLRLGATDDDKLTPILERVLPRLLPLLNRQESAIREKCVEVLGHIHERCQNQGVVHVPLAQLVNLYKSPSYQAALVSSFLIKFVETGFEAADPSERVSLLNSIFDNISGRLSSHRPVLIKIIISSLSHIVFANDPRHNSSMFPALSNLPDKLWLIAAFRDILLLHPKSQSVASDDGPDFGFSQESWKGVAKIERSIINLKNVKLSVLRFLISSGFFEANDVFLPGEIACSDSSPEVVDLGDTMLRRFGKADVNEPVISSQLLSLYLGDDLHRCASAQLKMQLITNLCKSEYAVRNTFASVLKVIFDSAFGSHSIIKLTQYGMELLTFTLRHGSSQSIKLASNALLVSLLKLFQKFNEQSVARNFQSCRIRGLIYDAIANLISMNPSVAVNAIQIPVFLFRMLQVDVDEVRQDLKTALYLLANVYAESSPASTRAEIKKMLTSNCFSQDSLDAVRQCSLIWLSRLFPFADLESRYIALLLVSDSSAEVRETAKQSLIPQRRSSESEPSQVPVFPRFSEMMSYILEKDDTLLSRSAVVLKHVIIFLRMCLFSEVQLKSSTLKSVLSEICQDDNRVLDRFIQFLFSQFDSRKPSSSVETQDMRFEASFTLLQIVKSSPDSSLRPICKTRLEWTIEVLTKSAEQGTRSNFAHLLGLMFGSTFMSIEQLRSTLVALTADVNNSSKDVNFIHGCCLGLGHIIGACLKCGLFPETELLSATQTVITLLGNNNPLICSGACVAISTISSMGRLPLLENEAEATYSKIITRLQQLARAGQMESQVSENAILALGCIPAYAGEPATDQVVESLLSLSNIRQDDLLFAIGDALVGCCSVANNRTTLRKLLSRLLESFIREGSAIARCSGAVWTLFLVKSFLQELTESGDGQTYAITIQSALSSLLNDSRLLTQECASKGMAIIFQKSSTEAKEDLIRELQRSVPAMKKENEDSSVKEFFGIARELGNPSLIYQLLDVSCSHNIWSSKYGAQFATNSLQQITSVLEPCIKSVIPKLYRYQFDPLPQIKKTMKAVYSLDSAAVTENFDTIIKDLINCMVDRDARIRQSSCAAIQELISGRSFTVLSPHLESLYRNVFLVLDDLNDSVRAAALTLSVSLSSILERICDVNLSRPSQASATLAIVLPVLLGNGVQARSKEVNSIAISTLVRLIGASGPLIVPHVPRLLRTLLEALSSMEAQILNYAMFHTATLNVSQEQLEAVRLSLSKSSPISGALQICAQQINDSVVSEVISILSDILRQGTGLPTLDATAQFLSTLATNLPAAMEPHAVALSNTILQCIKSVGPSVQKSLSVALGHLANISSDSDLSAITARVEKLFFKGDLELCSLISKSLIEHIDSAKLKLHYSKLIPICYVGKFSSDTSASLLWKQCLEENALGVASSIRKYSEDIIIFAIKSLNDPSYEFKKAASLAIVDVLALLEYTTTGCKQTGHFDSLYRSLLSCVSCPFWSGKSAALLAFTTLIASCFDQIRSRGMVPNIGEILQNEFRRSDDLLYQAILFSALNTLSQLYPEIDFLSLCFPIAQRLLLAGSTTNAETSLKIEQTRLFIAILNCIPFCWSPSSGVQYSDAAGLILGCIRGQELAVQSAAFSSLEELLNKGLKSLPLECSTTFIDELFPLLTGAIRDSKHESIRSPALDVLLVLIRHDAVSKHLSDIIILLQSMPSGDSAKIVSKRHQILSLTEKKSQCTQDKQ